MLNTKRLAELLGISERLIYGMHSSGWIGPLPYKLGRRTLWSRKEIENWIEAGLPPRVKWVALKEAQARSRNKV